MGGELLEGEFFRGPLLLERTEAKNSTREFGSKIGGGGGPKFVSRNSALNSGSRGAKSPVQTFGPDKEIFKAVGLKKVVAVKDFLAYSIERTCYFLLGVVCVCVCVCVCVFLVGWS